jgi:hypothetical protein
MTLSTSSTKKQPHPMILLQELQNNIQIYHWLTDSYAHHMATDKLYKSLQSSIDRFVETYIGRYGRINSFKPTQYKVSHRTPQDFVNYLKEASNNIEVMKLPEDLASLRDDIVASINQTVYLLSMK